MKLSYWEKKSYFSDIDLIVAGSGIVGLFSAYFYKLNNPLSKVVVVERSFIPYGASTRNAGFACFGSASEIKQDLQVATEVEVFNLYAERYEGLLLMRQILGDKRIGYEPLGGYEIFDKHDDFIQNMDFTDFLNRKVASITGKLKTYQNASEKIGSFGFKELSGMIFNTCEGQLDTGKMMQTLTSLVRNTGIEILNGFNIKSFESLHHKVVLANTEGAEISCRKLLVATNGFAKELLPEINVEPARAQVVITEVIPDLKVKGSFHFDAGYYYFRNVDNRILLGGARNSDFKAENTSVFNNTPSITNLLMDMLHKVILPGKAVSISHSWSGIMGLGPFKKPTLKAWVPGVYCAVGMGGMGVALGALTGKKAAEMMCAKTF